MLYTFFVFIRHVNAFFIFLFSKDLIAQMSMPRLDIYQSICRVFQSKLSLLHKTFQHSNAPCYTSLHHRISLDERNRLHRMHMLYLRTAIAIVDIDKERNQLHQV